LSDEALVSSAGDYAGLRGYSDRAFFHPNLRGLTETQYTVERWGGLSRSFSRSSFGKVAHNPFGLVGVPSKTLLVSPREECSREDACRRCSSGAAPALGDAEEVAVCPGGAAVLGIFSVRT